MKFKVLLRKRGGARAELFLETFRWFMLSIVYLSDKLGYP